MVELSRRSLIVAAAAGWPVMARAEDQTAWDFNFTSIEETPMPFAQYRGRVLLVVNTASFCGFTYQYEALEKLHRDNQGKGLTVVGVPSGDFNQESKTDGEVKDFCDATFGVEFPMTTISHVKGPDAHPFYKWVKAQKSWEPSWNFGKVLVARDGRIMGCFGSSDEPGSMRISRLMDHALSAKA